MKRIFTHILLGIAVIGGIWLLIRVAIIDWYLCSQSFWSFVNPWTHVKAFLFLLKDPDIYVTIFCGWLGLKLLNDVGKTAVEEVRNNKDEIKANNEYHIIEKNTSYPLIAITGIDEYEWSVDIKARKISKELALSNNRKNLGTLTLCAIIDKSSLDSAKTTKNNNIFLSDIDSQFILNFSLKSSYDFDKKSSQISFITDDNEKMKLNCRIRKNNNMLSLVSDSYDQASKLFEILYSKKITNVFSDDNLFPEIELVNDDYKNFSKFVKEIVTNKRR